MTTVITTHHRRAAHGKHRCSLCGRAIAANEVYEDQRCADGETAWTVRSHLACISAYHSWDPPHEGSIWRDELSYDLWLDELSDGHLPPCPLAWGTAEPDAHCTCEEKGQ